MSSTTITVLRCDRCGHETEVRAEADRAGWGRLSAASKVDERSRAIGAGQLGQEAADLCAGCTDQLFVWWATPDDVVQPTPPAPETPRARPAFTLEDRQRLAPLLIEAMRGQVADALAHYREQVPTALFSQDIVPEALAGMDDRAFTLAKRIVEQLGEHGR